MGSFLDTRQEPRVRRARDALRIGVGLVLVLGTAIDVVRITPVQDAIIALIRVLPDWAELGFWFGYGVAGVYAATVIIVVLVKAPQHPYRARDVLVSVAGATALALLAMRWKEGVWPSLFPEFGLEDPDALFPIVRVAIVTTTVLAVSPHVARPLRRLGSAMIVLAAFAGFGLGFGFPSDAIASVGIGLVAAGGTLLAFGSPIGFPDTAVVSAALSQLGNPLRDLAPALDQSWGTRRLLGQDETGRTVEVKAYGRDAADTQLAAKVWRALWYRDTGPAVAYTRLQAAEHEALMLLFAERAGAAAVQPVTAGLAGDDVAILAVTKPGEPLASLSPDQPTDEDLTAIWRHVTALHAADMAHGNLGGHSVLTTDDGPLLAEFLAASLGAGERTNLDVVSLTFALSSLFGVERAVDSAASGIGRERLAEALPYFQLPALPRQVRRSVDKPKNLMKEVRETVADAVGVDAPEPVELRRVSVGRLLMAALLLLAANVLISQLANIDYAAVWDVIQDGSWLVLLIALPVAWLTFIPEATGMIAAVGRPLPMRPLVILQVAVRFIGLAVPSAAGRVAMNSAFLVKFGVSSAIAVVQGAIDGLSGFIVEAGILAIALLVSEASVPIGGDVDFQRILLIMLAVVVVGAAAVFMVAKLRAIVLPVIKDALGSVSSVVSDPRRLITLLTSNFLARLALAVGLWLILRAIDVEISLAVVLAVTVATNLLAGLVPIPGGIGVAEAVLTSWLVLVGVPEASAFAATIVYRMWTFYVPAVVGFFAVRWLEARDYL